MFKSIKSVPSLIPRRLPEEFRDFNIIYFSDDNFSDSPSNGIYKCSKILLNAYMPFFEPFECNEIEIKRLNRYGLDLIKLIHGDISKLNLDSNPDILEYIFQCEFLLVNKSFIYELCDRLLKTDNDILPIIEHYHRIHMYSRYIPLYPEMFNLEDNMVIYLKYSESDLNFEYLNDHLIKWLSANAIKHLKHFFESELKDDKLGNDEIKNKYKNLKGQNFDILDYCNGNRKFFTESTQEQIDSLINYDSISNAIFRFDDNLYQIVPHLAYLDTIEDYSEKLIDFLNKFKVPYFVYDESLWLGTSSSTPVYEDQLPYNDDDEAEKLYHKMGDYGFRHISKFDVMYSIEGNISKIPMLNSEDQSRVKEIESNMYIYDIPETVNIPGIGDVPIREILEGNDKLEINKEVIQSLRFRFKHLRVTNYQIPIDDGYY